ncbi:unnamed protein product [Durusdinium trenchii]|uniref:PDZ domain-containing protein n=1 Tax=Durusdinium trenchii TaxID=1381693 RepID=A0ABP0PQZ4_9DINO
MHPSVTGTPAGIHPGAVAAGMHPGADAGAPAGMHPGAVALDAESEKFQGEQSLAILGSEEAQEALEPLELAEAKEPDAELRVEQSCAVVASEEAQATLELAETKEKDECEESATKEVENSEALLEHQEKEIALAKAEREEAAAAREEAAAARVEATEHAMQEVALEMERLREGQSMAALARSEAQEAQAEALKQEGQVQRMELEVAEEVTKWESQLADKERGALSRYAEKEQELLGETKAEQQVAAGLRIRELALRAGEEDLLATLRKRDHAMQKQEKEVQAMESSAEAMRERAQHRAEELAERLQERAQELSFAAEARENHLAERERELNSVVTEQLEAMEDLKKLRSDFHKAETAAATLEADLIHQEVSNRVLVLEAKSRDTQLGFVVGGFDSGQLIVSKVLHGSWAEQKGLKEGDELTGIDGKDVKELKEPEILESLQSRRPLKITFLNPDKGQALSQSTLSTQAAAKPRPVPAPSPAMQEGAENEFWQPTEKQAESFELLADESVKQLGLDLTGVPPSSVRIKQVLPDSWADSKGVNAGDELVMVNGSLTSALTQSQIGTALRHRPLRITMMRSSSKIRRSSTVSSKVPEGELVSVEATQSDERLGFKPAGKPPGRVYIEKLFPKSWAEKQGLLLNDVLEEVNGQKLTEISQEELDRLIKLRPLKMLFRRSASSHATRGSTTATSTAAAALQTLKVASKLKPKPKAIAAAPAGPLRPSVDLELPAGEKQLGFVPWGLPPARVMVRQVTGSLAQKAFLQAGHELVEVNGVNVRDIPRSELERTLLTRPLKLHFVASEDAGAFAVPAARDAEIEDEEVQAGILDLVATPANEHLGFETTSSLSFNAVEVAKVSSGSWAQRMRIRIGDHFLSIDGTPVGSYAGASLNEAIKSRTRPMRLRFRRQGQNVVDEDQRRLDVLATEADTELGFLMSGQPPSEIIVSKVIPGSWAAQRGLQEKDELVAVAGQPTSSLSGAGLMRYLQSVRPLRLRFHLAPGGPLPPRPKPKAEAKPEPKVEPPEPEATPKAKAKGRLGRAKLAQMLVGDMMKAKTQEEEVPTSPQSPPSPVAPAPPVSPAAPVKKAPAPTSPKAPAPSAPAVVAKAVVTPAKPKAVVKVGARPSERPGLRPGVAQEDSSSDDDAMVELSASVQDKDLGFDVAQRSGSTHNSNCQWCSCSIPSPGNGSNSSQSNRGSFSL